MSNDTTKAAQPGTQEKRDARWWLEAIVDIWADLEKAPEHRCYVDGALGEAMTEAAALLRANAAAVPADTVQLADTRRGWVYLAGPMTGYEDWNFPAFHKAAAQLRGEGWSVVNPADHGLIDGAEWADYLRFDIAKIAGCESIALLPGWSQSKGARLEVHVAQALMMPIRLLEGAEALSIGAAAPSAPQQVNAAAVPEAPELDDRVAAEIARGCARNCGTIERAAYKYLQNVDSGWKPHQWVLRALKDAYRRGFAAAPSAPVLAEAGDPVGWRVALVRSSHTPEKLIPWLADDAKDADRVERHHSFVRWLTMPAQPVAQQPVQGGGDAVLAAVESIASAALFWADQREVGTALARHAWIKLIDTIKAALPPAQPAPQAQGDDVRTLSKWLNEESTDPIDRQALARVLSAATALGLPLAQEPKYTTDGLHLINRHSGETIPRDEPVFLFRARDALAVRALRDYLGNIKASARAPDHMHADAVVQRVADFERFASAHPERMKWPDTATTSSPVAQPEALPVRSPNFVPADLQAMNARQAQTIKTLQRQLEAPQPAAARVGLSEAEIGRLESEAMSSIENMTSTWPVALVRAVERAHGIASPVADGGAHAPT